MPPPTHGPHCRTIFCYPRACSDCRQEVYYWSCTCGSHVLFDQLGEPWPKHGCARQKRLLPLRPSSHGQRSRPFDETNPMLFVRCELCDKKVRRGRVEEHERVVHRRGQKVAAVAADFDDCYDEDSLRQRLGQALGVRISMERRGDWGSLGGSDHTSGRPLERRSQGRLLACVRAFLQVAHVERKRAAGGLRLRPGAGSLGCETTHALLQKRSPTAEHREYRSGQLTNPQCSHRRCSAVGVVQSTYLERSAADAETLEEAAQRPSVRSIVRRRYPRKEPAQDPQGRGI